MSKKKLSEKERAFEAIRECWDPKAGEFRMAEYANDEVDILVILDDPESNGMMPIVIIPTSARAKTLFIAWGMHTWATGIAPPQNAMSIFPYIPGDWTTGSCSLETGAHIIQEITLPPALAVVH